VREPPVPPVPTVPTASFLARLGAGDRDDLLALGRPRRHPAHSILFFEGDEAHDVVVVRAGEVKVAHTLEGREVVLDVLGGGDVLGELSAVDGGPRSATATALTAVEVSTIPVGAFMAFLAERPDAGLTLLRCIAGRLRDASRRQVEYGALDGLGRVCRRLVELVDRYGETADPGAGVRIAGPLTQSDIAAWAGLSREAVVRALHGLRSLGWVVTTPRSITVVDVDAVTARAGLV
jgi:CRP/FNR family transcriptional regulator, cyclic AMP receptor protein